MGYQTSVKRESRLPFLLKRTPVVAGGLVFGAVLVGILFYAQAGLLFHPEVTTYGQATISHDEKPPSDSHDQAKKSVLEAQDPLPEAPETVAPAGQNQTPALTCDESAKTVERQTFERALTIEEKTHSNQLSEISKVSKLLSTVSLGTIQNKTKAENIRYAKAIETISAKYQAALAQANCQN